jgi:pyruvate/2-oxoglutarate dehydrogenase complex dihydrolipoamide dehydrogenase (E3) component
VDIQMRTNVPHIFAIGDIVGQPMLAHKAVHEAHVAAEVIAGELQGNKELASAAFNARVIPSVAYTDPEVAWVGLTEDQAKAAGHQGQEGPVPLGGLAAAPLPTAVTKALPSCCSTTAPKQDQETAMLAGATARSWAVAWSAPTRAT